MITVSQRQGDCSEMPKTDLGNNLASKFLKGISEASGHGEDDGGARDGDGMDTRRQTTYNQTGH